MAQVRARFALAARCGVGHIITRMRTLRTLILFIFGIAAVFAAASSEDTRAVQAEILRLENERIAALLKGDVNTLARLYADELVYVHAAGRIDTKQGYLAGLTGGGLTYVTLNYDPAPRVLVFGRDTAIASGRANIETKNKAGQVTKRVLTTTTVYARVGASWQIVSYQGTPVQP